MGWLVYATPIPISGPSTFFVVSSMSLILCLFDVVFCISLTLLFMFFRQSPLRFALSSIRRVLPLKRSQGSCGTVSLHRPHPYLGSWHLFFCFFDVVFDVLPMISFTLHSVVFPAGASFGVLAGIVWDGWFTPPPSPFRNSAPFLCSF